MFAVINNSQFFTAAHQLAKATRANFASYREAFSAALKDGYKAIAKMSNRCAEIVKAAFVKAAPRMSKASKSVVDALLALGGNRWTKAGHDRVYFNNANDLVGIETTYYKTGNLSSVKVGGEYVSNCRGRKLIGALNGAYVDLADNSVHYRGTCFSDAQFLRDQFESIIANAIA